jgi:signal transduction histidine kinase
MWVDRWVHAQLEPGTEDRDRARVVVTGWLVLLACYPLFVLMNATLRDDNGPLLLGLGMLPFFVSIGPITRRWGHRAGADLLCTAITFAIVANELLDPIGAYLFGLCIVPSMARAFHGQAALVRWGLFESAVLLGTVAVMVWRGGVVVQSSNALLGFISAFALSTLFMTSALGYVDVEITQRQRALHDQALREARDAALAGNEAKSVFLANMSHELRTPLNAIIGYSQLIREDFPDAESDLGHIETSGTHLLRLINNVLDVSQIESGRLELSLEAVEVGEVVKEVEQTLRSIVPERIELQIDLEPALAWVDRERLRQVLINLVSNALKFTQQGDVNVRVRTVEGLAVVEVIDSGPGMDPVRLAQVFARFERAGSTQPGTGLGLTISKELMHQMGGELTARSTLGEGSTFVCRLPAPAV